MKMHQETKSLQKFGKKLECQKIEFHFYLHQKTGGQHEILDLVVQIQKFFIGFENQNFHQNDQMFEMTRIIGWKFGIMFLWNLINYQTEH
jgi:hypothetical protein